MEEEKTTEKEVVNEEQNLCKNLLEYFEELDTGVKPLTLERKK